MPIYAVVDSSGAVVNLVVAETGTFTPPDGETLVDVAGQPVAIGWTYGSGGFVAPSAPAAATPPVATLAQRLEDLAALRYGHQTGGVMFQAAGASSPSLAASDIASTGMMTSSYVAATSGHWTDGTPWKMADGTFVPLTSADMQAMALKVLGFISACYAREAALATALATNLTTDITVGWPANT